MKIMPLGTTIQLVMNSDKLAYKKVNNIHTDDK